MVEHKVQGKLKALKMVGSYTVIQGGIYYPIQIQDESKLGLCGIQR